MAIMLVAFVTNALADAKIYIEPFEIEAGETKTAGLVLENPDKAVVGVQYTISLPEGLSITGASVDTKRIVKRSHTLQYNRRGNTNDWVITLSNTSGKTITGTSGKIATIEFTASNAFQGGMIVPVADEVVLTSDEIDQYGNAVQIKTVAPSLNLGGTQVEPDYQATLTTSPNAITFTTDNTEATINVGLDNSFPVQTMSFSVVLPAGVKPKMDGDELDFDYYDRLPESFEVASNYSEAANTIYFAVTSAQGETIPVGNGDIFYFNIEADVTTLKDNTNILFTEIITGDANAVKVNVADTKVSVKNVFELHAALQVNPAELTLSNSSNTAQINIGLENSAPVQTMSLNVVLPEGIKPKMDGTEVDFDYCDRLPESFEVASNYLEAENTVIFAITSAAGETISVGQGDLFYFNIVADTKTLSENATIQFKEIVAGDANSRKIDVEDVTIAVTNAQIAIDREDARIAANKEAYDKDVETIKALQTSLNAAKAAENEYAEYIAAEDVEVAQQAINGLTASATENFEAVAESGEYQTVVTDEAKAAAQALIDAVSKNAKDAQAEAARVKANNVAHAADVQLAEVLQQEYAAAIAGLEEYAEQDEANTDLKQELAGLKDKAGAALDAVKTEGEYESVVDAEAIRTKIATVKATAEAAKKAAEDEAARIAANENAYEADCLLIESLQEAYTEALSGLLSYVEEDEDNLALANELAGLKNKADAALDAVKTEGEYESVVDAEAIRAKIASVKATAEAAKKAAEDEAARIAANENAYEADCLLIESLQEAYTEALSGLLSYVEEDEDNLALANELAGLKNKADAALDAVKTEGEYESVVDAEAIRAKIASVKATAEAAKKAAEDEAARIAANENAYEADCLLIESLQEAYTEALSGLQSYVEEDEDNLALANELAGLKNKADAALDAVKTEGEYESVVDAEAIRAKIASVKATAEAAKEADNEENRVAENNAAADADRELVQELIGEFNQELEGLSEFVENKYNALASELNGLDEKIDEALADVETEGEYQSPVDAEGIRSQIAAMKEEADGIRRNTNESAYRADMLLAQQLYKEFVDAISTDLIEYAEADESYHALENEFSQLGTKITKTYEAVTESGKYVSVVDAKALREKIANVKAKAEAAKALAEKAEVLLADGVLYNGDGKFAKKVTYTRYFQNTKLQALYLPFEVSVEQLDEEYEVYNIGMFTEESDEVTLKAVKMTTGTLQANYPYFIRAKETGKHSIELENVKVYNATESKTVVRETEEAKYTFSGIYQPIEDMRGTGYYAMRNGDLMQAADASSHPVSLGAYRWYMNVESMTPGQPMRVNIKVEIVDDEVTAIENIAVKQTNDKVYTIDGKAVSESSLRPGIYIKNGKKFIIK